MQERPRHGRLRLPDMLDKYLNLVQEVETRAAPLRAAHAASLQCRKGCASCCTDITVLPAEWYGIVNRAKIFGRKALEPRNNDAKRCPFLKDDACDIYDIRPLICRVHGLPLSYPLEEYDADGIRVYHDPPERHILWCDLNFLDVDKFDPGFAADLVYDMVWLQTELSQLNDEFLKSEDGRRHRPGALISLRKNAE